jgi:hypothetical protein
MTKIIEDELNPDEVAAFVQMKAGDLSSKSALRQVLASNVPIIRILEEKGSQIEIYVNGKILITAGEGEMAVSVSIINRIPLLTEFLGRALDEVDNRIYEEEQGYSDRADDSHV